MRRGRLAGAPLILAALVVAGLWLTGPSSDASSISRSKPLVGAIRWDGWYGGAKGVVGKVLEECLSPKRYHHRAPFFTRVVSDEHIEIGPYTQEIVDREIAEAKRAGIDYFAYVAYDPSDPLTDAFKLHMSSRRKQDVRFCMVLEAGRSGDAATFETRTQRFVALMKDEAYLRLANGRPLFYLGFVEDRYIEAWGGRENARKLWDGFRRRAQDTGAGNPFIAVMDFSPRRGKELSEMIGADAISAYAIMGDGGNETPYSRLREVTRQFWNEARELGVSLIPTAMAGWDRRPRIERPHPWEPWQKAGEGMNRFYHPPTPAELAEHVREAVEWLQANPRVCTAGTILIYAWNEHDEGGWICPTLGEGHARIDALENMWRTPPSPPLAPAAK